MKHAADNTDPKDFTAGGREKRGKHGKHAAPEVPDIEKPQAVSHAEKSDAAETRVIPRVEASDAAETQVIPRIETPADEASSGDGRDPFDPSDDGSDAFDPNDGEQDAFDSFAPVESPGSFGMPDEGEAPRKRYGKIVGIVLGSIAALLAIAYFAGVFFFSGHFFPNTTLAGDDISLESTADVENRISQTADSYSLHVEGWGLDLSLGTEDVGLDLDSAHIATLMIGSLNPWAWPVEVFQSRDVGENMVGVYNDTGLNDLVRAAVEEHNKTAEPSKDATIGYSAEEGRVVVIPETRGTQLSADAVVAAVDEAVTNLQTTLRLDESALVAPEITSDDPRLASAAEQANAMLGVDMPLMMGGVEVARVNGELVASWITLGEDFSAKLDDGLLSAWADEFVAGHNTVGTERTYTRPDGKVITIAGGVYGWEVDRDALIETVRAGVSEHRVEATDVPCLSTAAAWNGLGAPDWGGRYIDIDLSEQHVYFYDGGALVWDSPCISGKPSYDGRYNTSTGVFTINTMASPSKLIGYENGQKIYESTVQYWMPFDGNVIGLHDADWQPWGSFYAGMYADGYGSHGCVNLPPGNAASLYSMIYSGDVVISHW